MKNGFSLFLPIAFLTTAALFFILTHQTSESPKPVAQSMLSDTLPIARDSEVAQERLHHNGRDIASKIEKSKSVDEPLNEWLNSRKQTDFHFQIAEDSGKILTVLGGHFKGVGQNEESAFEFLSEFANKVGVNSSQIDKNSLFKHQTTRKQVYGFEQAFKGQPVFDSYIKVETKQDDGSAYMILNNLKVIPQSTQVPEVIVNIERAKKNALAAVSEKFTTATPTEEPLVIYVLPDQSIDLAWSLWLQGEHVSEFILVSATTGEVLANYSAQSHQNY